MALRARIVQTDDSGDGTVGVGPCYYSGTNDDLEGGSVVWDGSTLESGMVKRGDETAVNGEVAVQDGPADSEITLFFDFSS